LRAGLLQALTNLVVPDVLADRHPDPYTAELDRPRQRTGLENAFFVENAVIRQIVS
jgi:hypothetical protein